MGENNEEKYKSNLLNEWLLFIENPESEELEMITKKVPEIKKAKEVLTIISADSKAKRKYEARQNSLKEKASLLGGAFDEGIKQGIEKGIEQGIKQGLKEGIEMILEIKFGEAGLNLVDKIKKIEDIKKLENIKIKLKEFNDIKEIEKLLS